MLCVCVCVCVHRCVLLCVAEKFFNVKCLKHSVSVISSFHYPDGFGLYYVEG